MLGRIAIAFCIALAAAGSGRAQETQVSRLKVSSGSELVLYDQWKCWKADCSFLPCRLDTVGRPRNGTVTAKVVNSSIPPLDRAGKSTGICANRPIKALRMSYRPKRGFRGQDEVLVNIVSENRHKYSDRFLITVD